MAEMQRTLVTKEGLENMQKEFLIKSNPLKYYEENGRVEEYAVYFGYSVEMRE